MIIVAKLIKLSIYGNIIQSVHNKIQKRKIARQYLIEDFAFSLTKYFSFFKNFNFSLNMLFLRDSDAEEMPDRIRTLFIGNIP